MHKYSAVTAIWYRAYWAVFTFLDKYLYAEQCHNAAARACSLWVQQALDGVETANGCYRSLFAAAEHVLMQLDPAHLLGDPQEFQERIPLDTGTLACDMSRLYAAIWQAGRQGEWDRATIHKVAKRLSSLVPTSEDEWRNTEPAPIDDPVARLVRRAFDVMHEHECVDNPICDQSGLIWEREDTCSQAWIENERLAREGL